MNGEAENLLASKARTPSGNVISVSFGDIRSIFSPERYRVSEQSKNNTPGAWKGNQPLKQRLRKAHARDLNTRTIASQHSKSDFNAKSVKQKLSTQDINKQQSALSDSEENYFTPPATPIRKAITGDQNTTPKIKHRQTTLKYVTQRKMPNTTSNQADTVVTMQSAENSSQAHPASPAKELRNSSQADSGEEIKAISIKAVIEMFKRLENRIDGLEGKNNQQHLPPNDQHTQDAQKTADKVSTLEVELESCKVELDTLKRKNHLMKCANKLAFNAIDELNKRLSTLELTNAKKTVSIHGLYIYQEKKEDIGMELEQFFDTELGVCVNVDDFYFVGNNDPPVCIVSFATLQDKREVMRNKSYLKEITNKNRKPIYINEYRSTEANEKRKYESEIYQENNAKPSHMQLRAEFRGTSLMLDDTPCEQIKRVTTPSPMDIIDLSLDQLDDVLGVELIKGSQVEQCESRFIAYLLNVQQNDTKFELIQNAYHRVKLLHPSADHVICAYSVEDMDLFAKDYCDDGEHGAGRATLNYMIENNLQNMACYVVRYYGGTKLGADRFNCIKNAIASAILQQVAGTDQPTDQLPPLTPENRAILSPPKSSAAVRGRRPRPYRFNNPRPYNKSQQRGAYGRGRAMRGTRGTRRPYGSSRGAKPASYQSSSKFHQQRHTEQPQHKNSNPGKRKYTPGESISPINKRTFPEQSVPQEGCEMDYTEEYDSVDDSKIVEDWSAENTGSFQNE